MPYVGQDWRSPGIKWVKTEGGWQPLSDIHKAIGKNLHQFIPSTGKSRSRDSPASSLTSSISSPNFTDDEEKYENRAVAVKSRGKHKPADEQFPVGDCPKIRESSRQEREQHLHEVHRNLTLRYATVVRSSTSRESHDYFTLTEALAKMNFECAVEDQNCFPFICNTLMTIFAEGTFLHSTATLRKVVHRVTDKVILLALKTRMHTGLVLNMITKAKAANKLLREKVQLSQSASHSRGTSIIDARLKSLSKMKHQLKLCLRSACASPKGTLKLLDLPDDCLRKVIFYLKDPQDVLNLGLANMRLYTLTVENTVWIELYFVHHSECNYEELPPMKGPAPMAWMHFFTGHTQYCSKSSEEIFHAVTLCKVCSRVFWTGYNHPCFLSDQEAVECGHCSKPGLTAKQFLSSFFI